MCTYLLYTVRCDDPVPPENGRLVSVTQRTEGSTVTFMCDEGFQPTGERMATCRADRTWENDPAEFVCEPLQTTQPPATTSK